MLGHLPTTVTVTSLIAINTQTLLYGSHLLPSSDEAANPKKRLTKI
jgi:hypothetical protein